MSNLDQKFWDIWAEVSKDYPDPDKLAALGVDSFQIEGIMQDKNHWRSRRLSPCEHGVSGARCDVCYGNGLLAPGIETEGHDRAARRGAEHESPTAAGGDAQDIAQNIGGPSQ